MCWGACRVFEHSRNSSVLPISSWYYSLFMGSVFALTFIFLLYHQSCTHPLLSHPSFSFSSLSFLFISLPISCVGCLSVSETKQTESCVSSLITPRSWETASSQTNTAVSLSAMFGILQISPGGSWAVFFCVPVWPCMKGCVESKVGHTSTYSYKVDEHIRHMTQENVGCVGFLNPSWNLQMSCLVWSTVQNLKRKHHIFHSWGDELLTFCL